MYIRHTVLKLRGVSPGFGLNEEEYADLALFYGEGCAPSTVFVLRMTFLNTPGGRNLSLNCLIGGGNNN